MNVPNRARVFQPFERAALVVQAGVHEGDGARRHVAPLRTLLERAQDLTGFAGSPGHMPIVFSILVNDVPNPMEARRAQDRAAEILVAYLEADGSPKP